MYISLTLLAAISNFCLCEVSETYKRMLNYQIEGRTKMTYSDLLDLYIKSIDLMNSNSDIPKEWEYKLELVKKKL